MSEVIPAINAENFEDVVRKVQLVESHVKWVHLDIADGTFTPNSLWHDAGDLVSFETSAKIEVHLMLGDIDAKWKDWILPNVDRIIFHAEAARNASQISDLIKERGKQSGIAIKPETEWKFLSQFLGHADLVQTLAVPPGRAGQEFNPNILEKIKSIREAHPESIIEVDGGINLETGKSCVEHGANILVAANYIFGSQDIKQAILDLQNL